MEPLNLCSAARWLAGPAGARDPEGVLAALAGLPADDPAPGLEVDLAQAGARLAVRPAAELRLSLGEAELAALRRGLELLAAAGVPEIAALRETFPGAAPTAPTGATGAAPRLETGPSPDTVQVLLRLSPAVGAWLGARSEAAEEARDGSVVARLEGGPPDALLPWLLRLGPRVEVLEPRALRVALAGAAADLAGRYRGPPPEVPPPGPSS